MTLTAITAYELVWLDAVEKLSANMEKIFADIPTNLTPSAMAALGKIARLQ